MNIAGNYHRSDLFDLTGATQLIRYIFSHLLRYRKTIRAIEEGIEELPPIVPMLKHSSGREVPVNTNAELVFFCRRVYEFRLKRLIKNPS